MEYRRPKQGECYRHFKGNRYQVLGIARHSETQEELVVYQQLYGEQGLWVRPLEMFMSKVDKEKYLEVKQEYRFELEKADSPKEQEEEREEKKRKMLWDFLDLTSAQDKIHYLQSVRLDITEEFIGIVAQSLDFAENDGTLDERYEAVLRYLRTVVRYESGRLR